MKRIASSLSLIAIIAACHSDKGTGPKSPGTPPSLDSIAPRTGTVGTEVRIFGTGFSDSASVWFGTHQSPTVTLTGGSLFAVAPDSLTRDSTYSIRVANPGTASDSLHRVFTAVAPSAIRVNGVTRPTGLVGMTVIIEGSAFGDAAHGQVYFMGTGGAPIQAVIADSANDWTDGFIVTTVPQGTADSSMVWVKTATGSSDSVRFNLITSGVFSPSTIAWTSTTALPQGLQGLGAVFVPIDSGASAGNYVFAIGGADTTQHATRAVYSAPVQQSGALGSWATTLTQLPQPRAYAATVAATACTAALPDTTAAYLYVIGGQDSAGRDQSSVLYARVPLDGSVGAWQSATSLPASLHAAMATVFRGFIYVAGGADSTNRALTAAYRAQINANGSLGPWQAMASLPHGVAYGTMLNFGPYLYAVGGDSGTAAPSQTTTSGTEMASAVLGRIDVRTGDLLSSGGSWTPSVTSMSKARSKHSMIVAGGSLLVTSGVYSGAAGSSENQYAALNGDGTLGSFNGATGVNTIQSVLGYSLYNQAAISFVDALGHGHVLVLGGANRSVAGQPSAGVVYY